MTTTVFGRTNILCRSYILLRARRACRVGHRLLHKTWSRHSSSVRSDILLPSCRTPPSSHRPVSVSSRSAPRRCSTARCEACRAGHSDQAVSTSRPSRRQPRSSILAASGQTMVSSWLESCLVPWLVQKTPVTRSGSRSGSSCLVPWSGRPTGPNWSEPCWVPRSAPRTPETRSGL